MGCILDMRKVNNVLFLFSCYNLLFQPYYTVLSVTVHRIDFIDILNCWW